MQGREGGHWDGMGASDCVVHDDAETNGGKPDGRFINSKWLWRNTRDDLAMMGALALSLSLPLVLDFALFRDRASRLPQEPVTAPPNCDIETAGG